MENLVFGKDANGYKPTPSGAKIKTVALNASNVDAILKDVDESKFIQAGSQLPEDFELGYYVATLPIDNGNLRSTHIIAESENEILLLGVEIEVQGEIYYPSAKPSSCAHLADLVRQASKKESLQVVVKVGNYKNKEGEIRFSSDIVKTSTWERLSKKGIELVNSANYTKKDMAQDPKKVKTTNKKAEQETA